MKMFGVLPFISIIILQIFLPINTSVIGEPYPTPEPMVVRQLAVNVAGPGGVNTFGDSGLDVLRRGTLIIADALANVLGSISTFINMIQTYAQTGSIQLDNFSTSSQALTNRLMNLGTNAATSLMSTFSNEISPSGNGAAGSSFGINTAVPSSNQFVVTGGIPGTQTELDTGRQSTLAWTQGSTPSFPISSNPVGSPGISGQSVSISSLQPQFGGRVDTSATGRPVVGVTSISSANGGVPNGAVNSGSASGFGGLGGTFGWRGSGGGLSGWSDSVGGASGWRGSGGVSTLGGPGFISSWGGPSASINSANVGIAPGLSASSASGSTLGWSSPSGAIGWRGPSGIAAGWSGANGILGSGGSANGIFGSGGLANGILGSGGLGGINGWDSSGSFDTDVDGMDILNSLSTYGSNNVNNTGAISPLSTLMETFFNPLRTAVNSTVSELATEPASAVNSTVSEQATEPALDRTNLTTNSDTTANPTLTN